MILLLPSKVNNGATSKAVIFLSIWRIIMIIFRLMKDKRIAEIGAKKNAEKDKLRIKNKDVPQGHVMNICTNVSCRLRKAGCRGFEGCPGYMSK
jgi:hypothetical protein